VEERLAVHHILENHNFLSRVKERVCIVVAFWLFYVTHLHDSSATQYFVFATEKTLIYTNGVII
jgi:hypothetical protein